MKYKSAPCQHADKSSFFRTFLRPHNVSHHRKLPRPRRLRGASEAAAGSVRSLSLGASDALQLATARCRATDSTHHQRVVGRIGHGAGVGYGGNCWHSSLQRPPTGPRLLQQGLVFVEALPSTPGSARLCVGVPRQARLPARRPPGTGCVAAQGFAVARCSVDNEVEAATVVGVNLRRCRARQPLLRPPRERP